MSDPLYLEAKPGDLITAENWNELQRRVQKDIVDTTQKAVAGVTDVNHAKDSDTLQGKTADQLATDIINSAVAAVHLQSGYQQIFTVLHYDPNKSAQDQPYHVIEHKLEVIKTADWILDLGPEGGDGGGRIVAEGTPEDIVANPESHTGRFLAPLLPAAEAPKKARRRA